ncbi:amino acid ABC transporter substrate-binding protein [Paucilactobacillus nenjiangensis]|jgi:polar amino acid transport system substrate-binding protein|uniref:Amino acid ABC transporter substrate-binding protein n=1 Tax=Paucilactobacillus nenjiangensis TaxID=1296540 RepID=A0A5P1X4M0_9LACO|nr:amino acid ABC transporter substrate-binding protein [Paucilactobacillus nenjiangensis]QER67844.1 amino acid ABC transporter substrate-binding protein [Paucilactobacillus nenjiangensis]
MKQFKIWFLLLVLLVPTIFLSGCENVTQRANTEDTWTHIQKRGKVIIGLDDSFVPMGFRQKNGKLVGYDIDLARAVFKQYGIKVDFQPIDWSMKETELRNGTIDLIWNGYTMTPAREGKVLFSRPYQQNQQILVTKTKYNVNNFSDMAGKTLGVQNGSTGTAVLDENPKILKNLIKNQEPVLYDTFPEAFIDLNANRIQGILMDKVYAEYYIRHQKDSSSYKTYESSQISSENFAVGMRLGDKTLKNKIDSALGKMQKNGQLKQINEKWFGENSNWLGKP